MGALERDITSPVESEHQPMAAVQRMRMTFTKEGTARYISHLDLARAVERALNRAGLPIAYTQGFNRRPRLSLAAALPLGYTSQAEIADVWLTEPVDPPRFGEVADVALEHARRLASWIGEAHAMRAFRRHSSWYTKGFRDSATMRALGR